MNFKKAIAVILSVSLILGVLCSCSGNISQNKVSINVGALKGPSGLGMVELMENSSNGATKNNYNFNIAGDPSELAAKLTNGEIDMACLPTNMAASLYNKTNGGLEILSVTTLGTLYILSDDSEIKNIQDLKGKTLYATGKGSVPEYVLNYLLKQSGLDPQNDVNIEYKSEHSELAALMISGNVKLAMLPEPFATQAENKNKQLIRCIDLTKEWAKNDNATLAMGCVAVRKDFLESNKNAVDTFLEEYKTSTEFTNTNIEEAAEHSQKYSIMDKDIAQNAIPSCNIVYIEGDQMKSILSGFLKVLYNENPQSVGGKVPDDNIYYKK